MGKNNWTITSLQKGIMKKASLYVAKPDGIDVSDLYLNYLLYPELLDAFTIFAQSPEGIEFLADFAKKGQEIVGHKYVEDGKYYSQGANLKFVGQNMNYAISGDSEERGSKGPNGDALTAENGSQIKCVVRLNNQLTINNKSALAYKNDKSNLKKRLCYVLDRTSTIFHECMIHVHYQVEDFYDDCNINDSILSGSAVTDVEQYNGRLTDVRGSIEHVQGKESDSMFVQKGIPALKRIHKKMQSGLSPEQVEKDALDYRVYK